MKNRDEPASNKVESFPSLVQKMENSPPASQGAGDTRSGDEGKRSRYA